MDNFNEWWQALALPLKVYWSIAIPFTFLFLIQLAATLLGADHDHLPDTEVNADHGIGFQFFTLKNLTGFFTLFGWVGIASIDSGMPVLITLILSFIGGLAMMLVMASVVYILAKANADGTMKINKAIGEVGEVYLTIPGNRSSFGKVQIMVQGSVRTLEAMTDDEDDIPTGKVIRVRQILNESTLLVTAI
jgi:hypothetical protein